MTELLSESLEPLILGQSDGEIHLLNRQDNKIATLGLIEQAQAKIIIMSHSLDSSVYDSKALVDALSATARRSRHSKVRILIHDSTEIIQKGHRLLSLFQHLSSSIQVQRISQEHRHFTQTFLVVDDTGVLSRINETGYEGIVNFKSPIQARKLTHTFNTIWDVSAPDPELRRLSL